MTMANELTLVTEQSLSPEEQTELDGQIDNLIDQHKDNARELNALTFHGALVLASADKSAKEKAAQSFLTRFKKIFPARTILIRTKSIKSLYRLNTSRKKFFLNSPNKTC